ncbi:uncharacterized protein [Amphiura filiformis]|uniref:uncharacterized protein n=1 Tax=Amphiura filiformis TaxID=82378 RepID=UPI003B20BAD8
MCRPHTEEDGMQTQKACREKKGVKLADGKTLDGKGRLHRKRVDALQAFYGKALRTNKGNPEAASAETMAGLYHYAGDHSYCPTRNDTWCNFKKDELSGTNNSEPVDDPFTPAMVAVMKPIYDDLSDVDLLSHCSQCLTQNANESYNSLLWKMAPKEQYSSATQIRTAMCLSTISFNVGWLDAGKRVMAEVVGNECITSSQLTLASKDKLRIRAAQAQALLTNKRKRVLKRLERTAHAFRHSDHSHYLSGGYHVGSTSKRPRTMPRCRTCGAPMKGHGN